MESRHLYKIWDGEKMHNPDSWGWGVHLSLTLRGWELFSGLALVDRIIASISDGKSKLLQCTGLKDENGTLIWEGDIVKDSDDGLMGVVFWNKGDAAFDVKGRIQGDEDVDEWDCGLGAIASYCVALGNIYENPELLPE